MIDLDKRIQEAMADWQQVLDTQQQQRAQRDQESVQQLTTQIQTKIDDLRARLVEVLGEELLVALNVTFEGQNPDYVQAVLTDGPDYWRLRYLHGRAGNVDRWELTCSYQPGLKTIPHAENTLRRGLLVKIGLRRIERQQEAVRRAAETAEHERYQAQINEQVRAAQTRLWQWPQGRELTLYHWRWQTGSVGEYGAEYDSGWSSHDQLNDGWLQLGTGRRLRLINAHLPVVEQHTFNQVSELPDVLREDVVIHIAGIRQVWINNTRAGYKGDPGGSIEQDIGIIPVLWVRDLLDS